jgi:hypothetical protein
VLGESRWGAQAARAAAGPHLHKLVFESPQVGLQLAAQRFQRHLHAGPGKAGRVRLAAAERWQGRQLAGRPSLQRDDPLVTWLLSILTYRRRSLTYATGLNCGSVNSSGLNQRGSELSNVREAA